MTLPATTYDLVLMLDPEVEQQVRAKVVADVLGAIAAQGELVRHDEWGSRAMAYQIDHKAAAEYHLVQFHAATPELIAGLNRSLRITDGIMRYRINKLQPGTPQAPDLRAERATPAAEPAPAAPAAAAPTAVPAERAEPAAVPAAAPAGEAA